MIKPTITAYQIRDLEKDVDGLKADVNRIMTNHLPHIQNSITEMNGKIDNLANRVNTAVGVNIILIIGSVIGIILLVR